MISTTEQMRPNGRGGASCVMKVGEMLQWLELFNAVRSDSLSTAMHSTTNGVLDHTETAQPSTTPR